MDTKICPRCGIEYPRTAEYYNIRPNRSGGVSSWCKTCTREHVRNQRHENKHYQEYLRQYYKTNREKIIEQRRKYYQNNREKEQEYKQKYYQNNCKKLREYNRKWTENNPGYYSQKYQEWAKNNPGKVRLYARNRRARLACSIGSHTLEELQIRLQNQHNKCFYCGCDLDDKYHVDHLVPLSRGGSNWIENLVIACASCNSSKKDKLPVTFIANLLD